MIQRKHLLATTVAALLVATTAWSYLLPAPARAAPNVTFQTLKGQKIALQSLRGRPVLVNFWATTCAICMEEMPHLIELYKELNPAGFEIIGVAMSYDPPNQVLELTEATQLPYDISLDLDSAIATAFDDVQLTPSSFLIDPEGKIVLNKLGALDLAALRHQIQSYL